MLLFSVIDTVEAIAISRKITVRVRLVDSSLR